MEEEEEVVVPNDYHVQSPGPKRGNLHGKMWYEHYEVLGRYGRGDMEETQ